MKKTKIGLGVIVTVMFLWLCGFEVTAGSIYESPYVTFSPDGQAWTTNAGDTNMQWYEEDGSDDVVTGRASALRALRQGEHYYPIDRSGMIPVGRWTVTLSKVRCSHNHYPGGDPPPTVYHGVEFVREVCLEPHFSAWSPMCADCGALIAQSCFYMSKEAVESIDAISAGEGIGYYYLCPFNGNLEQGVEIPAHKCKDVSANRYRVEYCANTDGACGGYMQPSFHMYDNAELYEGKTVTPQTRLNKNAYSRIGWKFNGWNTRADGTGVHYEDGEEILNLCEGDYKTDHAEGNIKLYAEWAPSSSTLEIDPAGGTYRGSAQIYSLTRDYRSVYELDMYSLEAPQGPTVYFHAGGANAVAPITGTMHFEEWLRTDPFSGKLEGNSYLFSATGGHTDRITAGYANDPIILPLPVSDDKFFGGWYYDEAFEMPAGNAGESFVPTDTLTLYAQWVDLLLVAKDNYDAYDGAGAVDLSWSQSGGQETAYKLYQKRAGEEWGQIFDKAEITDGLDLSEQFEYSGEEKIYTVPYTGFYILTGYGAQGGNYGSFYGGAGGRVSGSFRLEEGEVLKIRVGGQNGYNGGGAANRYANGGGCTTVYSDRKGLLLVAGGGGGAAPNGNGYGGGSAQSLVTGGMNGEAGASGGGGGYLGGKAGELIVHKHVWGVCNHVHSGNSSSYGGCYTIPVQCGQPLEAVYTGRQLWFWGGSDEIYCPNCGKDSRKGESCTGHYTDYYNHVCPVHGNQENNSNFYYPGTCEVQDHYAVSCGRTEEYVCGYPYDNYVISSKSAYGGSSYINTMYARSYAQNAGVKRGNGFFEAESEDIGYFSGTELKEVPAEDRDAPEKIESEKVHKSPIDETRILVEWEKPSDIGTVYYHQAESYTLSGDLLYASNITKNDLCSGIRGYYYCLDESNDTEPTQEDAFLEKEELQVKLLEERRYLHIRAVDVAGNLSDTIHIPIGSSLTGDDDVAWKVYTEQMLIWEDDNVYAASDEKTYYVRCDGETPFALEIGAYMRGPSTVNYQLDRIIVESGDSAGEVRNRNIIALPKQSIQSEDILIRAREMDLFVDGDTYLRPGYVREAVRGNRNRRLILTGELVADERAEGKTLDILPVTGADWRGTVVYSDYALDVHNGLRIICDGTAPEIHGLEILEDLILLDRRDGEMWLRLSAEDALSGVRELSMEIHNSDNDATERYVANETGRIEVCITEDEPLFSGDFTVTVRVCDNVGNENIVKYGTTEFDLQVEVQRVLEPHDPMFKQGESGVLNIVTWGYAERVEIEFPQELTGLDENLDYVYVYELKQRYRQEEQYPFMIPLYTPEEERYTITVRAYKGDKMLELHPAFDVMGVAGTVLDELRTRLR